MLLLLPLQSLAAKQTRKPLWAKGLQAALPGLKGGCAERKAQAWQGWRVAGGGGVAAPTPACNSSDKHVVWVHASDIHVVWVSLFSHVRIPHPLSLTSKRL